MHIQRGIALLLATLFIASALPAPATANPLVPYCPTSIAGGLSVTADQVDPALCEQLTGRVFPEAFAHADYIQGPNGFTGVAPYIPATDYIGFMEFQAGLDYLAAQYPDYIEVHQVASSFGTTSAIAGEVNHPVYMLEISNENSPIPRDEKQNLLFMLSIHGNEKGGREGGFRVLEDLVKNIGFATETIQNGAGMPESIEKPTGGAVSTYHDYLDFMNVFLLFPNPDGWACDDIEYLPSVQNQGLPCPGLFVRGNGAGTDLNRQTPTIGWHNSGRQVLGEPEAGGVGTEYPGFANWLVEQRENSDAFQWTYGIDIHGMLNHKNFGAIMLPAGSMTPQEMHRSLSLAETLKERWNADSHFDAWRTLFQTEEAVWDNAAPGVGGAYDTICATVDCPLPGSALFGANPAHAAGSSEFAEYYTVIDAIGYTDSGFNGDFFAQSTGLNAPGYDIELAYNHITTSSQYEGPGAIFNDYHVHMVRHIVKSFMDAAALDVQISYETAGSRTAYVPTQFVVTNLDDVDAENNPRPTPGGWADQNPGDDKWDYGADQPFQSYSTKYWEDIRPFICQDCGTPNSVAGVLESRNAADLTADTLANFDNLIISGSAINQFFLNGAPSENALPTLDGSAVADVDEAKVQIVMDWVRNGGNLVLTDAALNFFDMAGITDGAVQRELGYMGGIRMDLGHEMLNKVRGGVKQTYEPTPLGYGTTGASPNWGIAPAAFNAIEGSSVAGLVCPGSALGQNCNGRNVALGYVDLGEGRIQFMGSLLPDPTEEFYHPYGLDDYATTYSANQIARNMLGWDEVFASPPVTVSDMGVAQSANERTENPAPAPEELGNDDAEESPGVGLLALLAAIGVALIGRRRA